MITSAFAAGLVAPPSFDWTPWLIMIAIAVLVICAPLIIRELARKKTQNAPLIPPGPIPRDPPRLEPQIPALDAPAPQPAVMLETYPDLDHLVLAIHYTGVGNNVSLNGAPLKSDGFSPPLAYYTQADGSISTTARTA